VSNYPRARGRMLEVWAKVECPVCDAELEHVGDDYEDEEHIDCYDCSYCGILVSYVSPAKYGEYHDVPDKDRRYIIEHSLMGSRAEDEAGS
jgi:hypothetical protein